MPMVSLTSIFTCGHTYENKNTNESVARAAGPCTQFWRDYFCYGKDLSSPGNQRYGPEFL